MRYKNGDLVVVRGDVSHFGPPAGTVVKVIEGADADFICVVQAHPPHGSYYTVPESDLVFLGQTGPTSDTLFWLLYKESDSLRLKSFASCDARLKWVAELALKQLSNPGANEILMTFDGTLKEHALSLIHSEDAL